MLGYIKSHIQTKKPPKRAECETLLEEHPDLLRNIQNCFTKKVKFDAVFRAGQSIFI